MDFHQGTVTFLDQAGTEHQMTATRYEQVHDCVRAHGNWQLRLPDGQSMAFNGMLARRPA